MVPGRECGSCGVCCKIPFIDDEALQKPPGALCVNFDKVAGCKIYRTRPQVCRDYYCGWRMMPNLDDDWRPDKSGVFITDPGDGVSQQYRERGAMKLVIGSARAISRPAFLDFICDMVERGAPIYLAVPGPVGHLMAEVQANAHLAGPVRDKDRQRIVDVITGLVKDLVSFAYKTPVMPMRERH